MADRTLTVVCPCCAAELEVHAATGTVLKAIEPPKKPAIEDLSAAAKALQGEAARREEMFQKSFEAHKAKSAAADDLFDQLLKKAKERPEDKPKRAFDLD